MLATQHLTDYSAKVIDLDVELYRVYAPRRSHIIRPQTFIDGLYAYAPQDVFLKTEKRFINPIQVLHIRKLNGVYVATCCVVKAGVVKHLPIPADQPLTVQ